MKIDPKTCLAAFLGRDRRFAGRFYAGVTSTGVYCRPGCPAPLPKPRNVRFFPCAAAAEEAGFRACRRCRPETAPGTPAWAGTSATVARALRQIEAGVADDAPLGALAARLGVGERHLRRLFAEHLGASPVAEARTRRVHSARRLLDETPLRMSDVALAAGFSSVRRFNEAMRAAFGVPPTELRRAAASAPTPAGIALRLPFRPPFDGAALLAPLVARRPGLRVPGAWDPFETAARTILGQQVSVKAARTLAARLVARFGRALPAQTAREGLSRLFPRAEELADADVASIGIPARRGETIRALAREVALGRLDLGPAASLEEAERLLAGIPGVGPWTAQAIALRALGEPDAFPAGDLGLLKVLASGGRLPSLSAVTERARAWRPWRAYALIHLWTDLANREDA